MQLKNKIFNIRNQQVMLDRDLAELYEVKAIRLREQVKRNTNRFPPDFCFQLSEKEVLDMVSQNAIPSKKHLGGSKPYVFTEQGIAMLSSVLNSQKAIAVNIRIMRAFIFMRQSLMQNQQFLVKFQQIDQKLIEHDSQLNTLFFAMEQKQLAPKEGIFFEGQLFTAHKTIIISHNKTQHTIY